MYWYSDDRSVQFNFNRQKSGRNRAFYGHWSSPVFLTNILKYRLDRQLLSPMVFDVRCLTQRTCEANLAVENSSFIFTIRDKSVPLYHFKLAYIVLHMTVKKFFETHFQK